MEFFLNKIKYKDPDFLVVGLNKSGSYWLAAMLDAHPEINCFPTLPGGKSGVGEPHIFDVLGSIDEDGGAQFRKSFTETRDGYFADLVPYLDKVSRNELYDMFRERYSQWCDLFRKKRLVGEKTQEYIFYLDIIDYFYPEIKKICIIRDSKDRLVAFYFNQVRKGREAASKKIPDEFITSFVERVKKEYKILLDYPKEIYCYTYESMIQDSKNALTGVLKFLGAVVSEKILAEMIRAGSFEKLTALDAGSSDSSRKPGEELSTSHYRKGVAGDWKNYLDDQQAELVNSKLGELEKKMFKKYNLALKPIF